MKIKKIIPYIVIFTLLGVVGSAIGITIAAIEFEKVSKNYQLFLLIMMFLSLGISCFIQLIIHEAGHLIFGLLSGYKFLSFRIANIMLIKIDNKIKIKKYSLFGTAGQCLLEPPELKNNKMPVILYNLGGVLLNIISSIIAIMLICIFNNILILKYMLIPFAIIGIYYALQNGIPLSLEIPNDGMNTLRLKRNSKLHKPLWIQLKVITEQTKGKRIKEMPNEWFYMPDDEDITNEITLVIGILYCNKLLEEHKFKETKENIKHLLKFKNNILEIHQAQLKMDQLYCELIENNIEKAKKILTTKQKNYMNALKDIPSTIRTEYAIAKVIENDEKKCNEILEHFNKVKKTYPYQTEIEAEEEFINIIKNI